MPIRTSFLLAFLFLFSGALPVDLAELRARAVHGAETEPPFETEEFSLRLRASEKGRSRAEKAASPLRIHRGAATPGAFPALSDRSPEAPAQSPRRSLYRLHAVFRI